MAWIKMRTDLRRDGRVRSLSSALGIPVATVTGALFALWSVADEQTTDGFIFGWNAEQMDQEIGVPGMCAALADDKIKWLVIKPDGLQVPRFQEHNGESAKKRSLVSKRVAKHRKCNAPSVTSALQERNEQRYLEKELELEEELKKEPPLTPPEGEVSKPASRRTKDDSPEIVAIYDAYPRKVGRSSALKAIRAALASMSDKQPTPFDWLLGRVKAFATSPAGQAGKFTPHPATWFNGGRYEDDDAEWARDEKDEKPERIIGRIATPEELKRWNPLTGLD